MISEWARIFRESNIKLLIITSAILAGVLAGRQVAVLNLQSKGLVAILAALVTALVILRGGDRILGFLYLVAIGGFAIGHRSIYVGQSSFFVPSELIAWVLFLAIGARIAVEHRRLLTPPPGALLFLLGWCVLSLLWTPNALQNWDDVLSMLKLWVVALPIFVCTAYFVKDLHDLRRILRILMLVAFYMSLLALVQFAFPGLVGSSPLFFTADQIAIETGQGFVRSYFTFWGNSIGVIIIGWGLLVAFDELLHGRERSWKLVALGTLVLGLGAAYISGQRETWLALPVGLLVLAALSGKRSLFFLIPLSMLLLFLPDTFWARIQSALPGSAYFLSDTSALWRVDRYTWALGKIGANPILGIGLGGGLTHNEFLSFAVRVGTPAAIAFGILLLTIFNRLVRIYRGNASPDLRRFSCLFLALGATWLLDLSFHPVLGVPPMAVPYWFMIALAWQFYNLLAPADLPDLALQASSPAELAMVT